MEKSSAWLFRSGGQGSLGEVDVRVLRIGLPPAAYGSITGLLVN